MTTRRPPENGAQLLRAMRSLLDRGYAQAADTVLRTITLQSTGANTLMQRRMAELMAEAAKLAEQGARLTLENPILRAVLADLDDVMRANQALVAGAAADVQASGIAVAGTSVREMALPGVSDSALRALGVVWNRPDPEAIARLIEYTAGAAWQERLNRYGEGVGTLARQTVVRGMAAGQGPLATARQLRSVVEDLPAAYANTMMRTLQLTSYRDAQVAHRVANSHIITEQIRIAVLDERTCFPAGTMVRTTSGDKPIEMVSVGDLVLTHLGRYQKVNATMRRDYSGVMVTMRHNGGSLTATANHPILVTRGGNRDWITAESIKPGDCVTVCREDGGNDGDHRISNRAVERGIWNTDYGVATRDKARCFAPVAGGACMPVDAIDLKCNVAVSNVEIDGVTVNPGLLFERFAKCLKAKTDVAFRLGFTSIASIAARGTELLMRQYGHDTEVLFAGQTGIDNRWAAALFGTVGTLAFLRSVQKYFTATLARHVYQCLCLAFQTTYPVAVGIRGRYGVGFAANRADFGNGASLVFAFRAAIAGIPLLDFGGAQLKLFTADFTNEGDALTLAQPATGRAAIQAVPAAMIDVGLPDFKGVSANNAGSLYHDTIISSTATEIKGEEVYNLEVDGDHTYTANGVVVHNCMSCVALHGTVLRPDERINDHWNGRCESVTVVKGRTPPNVETGEAWFERQPETRQRAMMGASEYRAWQDGAITLRDYPRTYTDPVFGEMVAANSLKGMLGDQARRYYTEAEDGE